MRRRLPTESFLRVYSAFLRKHPELEQKAEMVMDGLATESRAVRVHTLHGRFKGLYAARVSQSYRLVFALEPGAVVFIDIGSHDEVY